MEIDPKTLDELVAAATAAREHAHAPYSGFAVGAAVLGADGRVIAGCNVENASYGLTICAERAALVAAVVAGLGKPTAVAVVVGGATAAAPCGACRQVMTELCVPDAVVAIEALEGGRLVFRLAEIIPHPFTASNLGAPAAGDDGAAGPAARGGDHV